MNKKIGTAVTAIALGSVVLTGCGWGGGGHSKKSTNAQSATQKQTEQAFSQQSTAVPYPASQLRTSLERENLARKLLLLNQADKVGYVYVMNFGKIIGYYVIKGKVSSNESQMTTSTLIETKCHYGNECNDVTVPAPGDDGSYSANEPGVFFFTASGTFVETDLNYLYSDQPLHIDVPLLTK